MENSESVHYRVIEKVFHPEFVLSSVLHTNLYVKALSDALLKTREPIWTADNMASGVIEIKWEVHPIRDMPEPELIDLVFVGKHPLTQTIIQEVLIYARPSRLEAQVGFVDPTQDKYRTKDYSVLLGLSEIRLMDLSLGRDNIARSIVCHAATDPAHLFWQLESTYFQDAL